MVKVTMVNTSPFWARFHSMMAGSLSIIPMYLLAKELFDKRTALYSAFIFSISTTMIMYSQCATSYSLFTLVTLLVTYLFLKIMKKNHLRYYILFTLIGALSLYIHYYSFFHIMALVLFYLLYHFFGLRDIIKEKVKNEDSKHLLEIKIRSKARILIDDLKRYVNINKWQIIKVSIAFCLIALIFLPWLNSFMFSSEHGVGVIKWRNIFPNDRELFLLVHDALIPVDWESSVIGAQIFPENIIRLVAMPILLLGILWGTHRIWLHKDPRTLILLFSSIFSITIILPCILMNSYEPMSGAFSTKFFVHEFPFLYIVLAAGFSTRQRQFLILLVYSLINAIMLYVFYFDCNTNPDVWISDSGIQV
ncbi:MAG: glycosyltransferase family 39 protein [Candidatus Thermoplasmatota archaeon]|nr:glycosyltransferase family 39 protein [Candidatus Thermoplasmatota archaeon]